MLHFMAFFDMIDFICPESTDFRAGRGEKRMENQPVRIAQMMTDMNYGGAEMAVLNIYRHIDRARYQFDFFALEGSSIPGRQEIEALGGRIYVLPGLKKFPAYVKMATRILQENRYPMVHSHMNTLSAFSLYAAGKAGIPVRIAHSHSVAGKGEGLRNLAKYGLRTLLIPLPTHRAACSRQAGKWLFGEKKFRILPNGVDFQTFAFDPEKRAQMRKNLGLEKRFVVGHIGRFCYAKNHEFLLEVFAEIRRKRKNALLLLVGEGPLQKKIQKKAENMGLLDDILFLKPRIAVSGLYAAMDVFLLPSRYEGMSMAAMEAQAAGLPCILSTAEPEEGRIRQDCRRLPLKAGAEAWAGAALEAEASDRQQNNFLPQIQIYTPKQQAAAWMGFYDEILEKDSRLCGL